MNDKDAIARDLARFHHESEPEIVSIYRILSLSEDDPREPVKLLEVNPETAPAGFVPIAFGRSEDVPHPWVIVEITPLEFEKLGELNWPQGWTLGEKLYETALGSYDASA
jgi:hypothetical protein